MSRMIFQSWLDVMGETAFSGDFDAFARRMALPVTLSTTAAKTVIDTEAALRANFDAWRRMLQSQEVTEMVRRAEWTRTIDGSHIEGQYTTDLLTRGMPVCEPYSSTALLRFEDGTWKMERSGLGTGNRSFPITVPRGRSDDNSGASGLGGDTR